MKCDVKFTLSFKTCMRILKVTECLWNITGELIAHVSWQCPQSNPDIQVTGYNILIDGKQYGNPMHDGVKTVRIKVCQTLDSLV